MSWKGKMRRHRKGDTTADGDKNRPAIVLTATVIPRHGVVQRASAETRRFEYLQALRFYSAFSRVYLLENSEYDILNDADFLAVPNCTIRKFSGNDPGTQGKGYHEFKMIDEWVQLENPLPQTWFKITGRLIIANFSDIYERCTKHSMGDAHIDRYARTGIADTRLMYLSADFYREYLSGVYREADDRRGRWIERIIFDRLKAVPPGRFAVFRDEPVVIGVAATTDEPYVSSGMKFRAKGLLRSLNYLFDPLCLHWRSK